jgi:hypothetical protein
MRASRLISMKISEKSDSYEEESKSAWVGIYVTLLTFTIKLVQYFSRRTKSVKVEILLVPFRTSDAPT